MGGINKRLRTRAFWLCARRDGLKCRICKKKGDENSLVVDHRDDNPRNNPDDGSNWQLLCRRDNHPSIKGKHSPVRVRARVRENVEKVLQDREHAKGLGPQMEKNIESECAFRHWLYDEVKKKGSVDVSEVMNSGAEVACCSPQSIKRYLAKCTSGAGEFMVIEGKVMFKPEFEHKQHDKGQLKPVNGQPEEQNGDASALKVFRSLEGRIG